MELAGKYASSIDAVIELAKNYIQQNPTQLANGDIESEMIARIIPAAMALKVDPSKVINSYIGQQ